MDERLVSVRVEEDEIGGYEIILQFDVHGGALKLSKGDRLEKVAADFHFLATVIEQTAAKQKGGDDTLTEGLTD